MKFITAILLVLVTAAGSLTASPQGDPPVLVILYSDGMVELDFPEGAGYEAVGYQVFITGEADAIEYVDDSGFEYHIIDPPGVGKYDGAFAAGSLDGPVTEDCKIAVITGSDLDFDYGHVPPIKVTSWGFDLPIELVLAD